MSREPVPVRPFRDTVIVYGVFALVVVVLAAVTGGNVGWAAAAAAGAFAVAIGYAWWRRGGLR